MASAAVPDATNISNIKAFAEAINGKTDAAIPSNYNAFIDPRDRDEVDDKLSAFIPVIDYSLLTSNDPQLHVQAVKELGKACKEWGFFLLVKHGITEEGIEGVLEATKGFFETSDEEKQKFSDEGVLCPIRYGTSMNAKKEEVHFWRDYFKAFTHPDFCIPDVPPGFRDIAQEYCTKVREIAGELYRGMSESLGLEANAVPDALDYENDFELFVGNYYPPCPRPDAALGQPPHSDNGTMTLLIANAIGGLQVHRDGKWINVQPPPNSMVVNIADQLEIITNGKYKAVLHRACLNNKATRVSVAMVLGPALDKFVEPIPELVENGHKPEFKGMNYREYFSGHQGNKLVGKTNLDRARGD